MRRVLFVTVLVALIILGAAPLYAQKALTPEQTEALRKAGFTDAQIAEIVLGKSEAPAAVAPTAVAADGTTAVPADEGLYVQTAKGLVMLQEETVKRSKSTSPLKMIATGGFGTSSVKGVLKGAKSPVQVLGPAVTVFARLPGKISPSDIQLIAMESRKDAREITIGKMSLIGGMTTNPSATDFVFERLGGQVYKAIIELKPGEYGFGIGGGTKFATFGVSN
jgi:hypothetical protein